MAFTRFGFKKNWNNANDFATVVNDEARVRADMQALHDESKEGLNKLMGELEAPAAASSIGAKDYEGKDSTTQGALDKLAEELKNVSEINAENLGANNIALDKKGETTLADQYNTGELAPTVHGALGRILEMFLRKAGGIMSGDLEIQTANPAVKARNTTTGILGKIQSTAGGNVALARIEDEKNQRLIEMNNSGSLRYAEMIDGVWTINHLLHTGNVLEGEKALGYICVEKITTSKTWTAPADLVGDTVRAYVFGGGGGGGSGGGGHADYGSYCGGGGGGGGGGHLTIGDISVLPGGTISAVIGAGGAGGAAPATQYKAGISGSKGGTSKFGSLSALGGDGGGGGSNQIRDGATGKGGKGGDGGTGGGGGSSADGGNGSYGGGGGGGNASYAGDAGNGGSGGTCGGNGGGGNATKKDGTAVYGVSAAERIIFEDNGGIACPLLATAGKSDNGGSGGYGSVGGAGWHSTSGGTLYTRGGGGGGGGWLGAAGGSGASNAYSAGGGGGGGGGFGPAGTGGTGCLSDYASESWGTASWAYGGGGGGFGPGGGSAEPGYGAGGRGGKGGTKVTDTSTNACNAGAGQNGGAGIIILVYRRANA